MLHLETDEGIPVRPAEHHRIWLDLLCNPEIEKLLILAPPEAAKTTWVLSAWVGCYTAFFPEHSVIIVSSDGPTATARSDVLRQVTVNDSWRRTFPDVQQAIGLPWTQDKWSLAPNGRAYPGRLHPTVAAYGTGGRIIGSRANILIADDLLNDENTSSEVQRSKTQKWVHTSFLSRRRARVARTIVIGTPWHPDDAYQEFVAAGDWVVCKTPLLQEENNGAVYATVSYPDNYSGIRLGEPIAEMLQAGSAA